MPVHCLGYVLIRQLLVNVASIMDQWWSRFSLSHGNIPRFWQPPYFSATIVRMATCVSQISRTIQRQTPDPCTINHKALLIIEFSSYTNIYLDPWKRLSRFNNLGLLASVKSFCRCVEVGTFVSKKINHTDPILSNRGYLNHVRRYRLRCDHLWSPKIIRFRWSNLFSIPDRQYRTENLINYAEVNAFTPRKQF